MLERKNWHHTANHKQVGKRNNQTRQNVDGEGISKGTESNHRSDIEVMTAQEVADLLRVSRWSVYEMVKRHDIPFFKVGRSVRFDRGDVGEWLKASSS